MNVEGIAMDMARGLVQLLWCPNQACESSVMQSTYAHEAHPHLLVTELVANNTGGSKDLKVTVNPATQPQVSYTGTAGSRTTCMKWKQEKVQSKNKK
jgi:hypothetical protein